MATGEGSNLKIVVFLSKAVAGAVNREGRTVIVVRDGVEMADAMEYETATARAMGNASGQ